MNRVRDTLLALLSREWMGLGIAALVAALLALIAQALPRPARTAVLALAAIAGAVLALAALRHLWAVVRTRRAHPPPGRLIDVGGYHMHVWAEGECRESRPPLVLFAGGHAAGYAIVHLHRAFRGDTRSILIDRPGTGWSDTGPFPRSTAREADEVITVLERAGERGPFLFAGHSFGGLLAANIARRRPDLAAGVVLLDPTPLETIVFGPRLAALREMRRHGWLAAPLQLFGINLAARAEARQRAVPAYAKVLDATRAVLGPEVMAWRALEARAGSLCAGASIYRELSPEGVAACAWQTVVYDGELGQLPVWLVGPKSDSDGDIALLPEAQAGDAANARRMFNFYARSRERYLATSTRAERLVAPPGSGHNFVYEEPEWTIAALRNIIERLAAERTARGERGEHIGRAEQVSP